MRRTRWMQYGTLISIAFLCLLPGSAQPGGRPARLPTQPDGALKMNTVVTDAGWAKTVPVEKEVFLCEEDPVGKWAVERREARRRPSYLFTLIADTSAGLSRFGAAPALNNLGTVAFTAQDETGRACLYTGQGGPLTIIACPTGEELDAFPSLNDRGTAAFVVRSSDTERLVTGDGGPLTTRYKRGDYGFYAFGPAALNQAGVTAFWVATFILSMPEQVNAGDGGEPTRIDRSESFEFTHFGSAPALNNTGTVAYSYIFRSPAVREDAIKIGDGQTTTTLYSDQGGGFSAFGNPVINDTETVAFFATLATGGSGIFRGNGGPVTTMATTGDVFSRFGRAPALNNSDGVAFFAQRKAGGSGIFTGPDPDDDRVIGTGDCLLGSLVTEVGFFRQGLNDAGQVAFFARLADGRRGIFRADPIVPGPSGRGPAAPVHVGADRSGLGFDLGSVGPAAMGQAQASARPASVGRRACPSVPSRMEVTDAPARLPLESTAPRHSGAARSR